MKFLILTFIFSVLYVGNIVYKMEKAKVLHQDTYIALTHSSK